MELNTDEALKIHIEGLQATLTKRNARIAELEEKLKLPIPLEPEIEKRINKAYKQGWTDCASQLMESTKDAALGLSKIRKDAFRLYLEGEKSQTHDESHPLSNGGLTCSCCKDLYFCIVCNDDIVRSKINQKERKDNLDELLWAITSIAKQDPCETVGHYSCANALQAVVEVVKSYSDGQAYVNEEFNQGLQTTLLLIINAIEKELE